MINQGYDWSWKLAPLSLNQQGAKLNQWRLGNCLWGLLNVFTLSSHWLLVIYSFVLIGYCDYSGCEIIIVHRKPLWFICTFDIVANRREEMEWVATWCWLLKELFQLCVLIKWTAVLWLESKKSSGKDFVTCMTKISCQSGRSLSRKQVMQTCKKHIGCLFVVSELCHANRPWECVANVAAKLQGQMPPNFFCFISRVYDPDTRKIVQKNLGHSDSVRCIIHIPERSQVFTVFF